jgi:hypothetical protein
VGLELPVWDYGRDQGIAVIGGYVYRGSTLTSLIGLYVYGDYGSGRIWALTLSSLGSPTNTLLSDTNLNISSFGVDDNGELYVCALDGRIYRFNAAVIPEFSTAALLIILLVGTLFATLIVRKRN